ncbi:general odorant-binding protein 1-like [Aricia agestis]|uniref:general odorant-binding protein 1-like n=1 Tax=Aricia agestis TaxID=91739 RepID=UPI001C202936|nr:general odorant-binding protein 1-like [Aricia agestis]
MKKLSIGFTKVINECREELDAGEHIIKDIENYWREEYALLNRDFGCMVMCMAGKHDMLNDGGTGIHHDSATEFAKKHGADEDVAKQVATMILDCEKQFLEMSDTCMRALETSKCFRTKIHELKWAPSMEEILEEVMSEV